MGLLSTTQILSYLARALVMLIVIPVHEAAHAFVSAKLGDTTAKDAGRLTLNPLAHFDPIGALCMIVAGFGWAKPVPVNARYFRHPAKDMMLVALAGPLTNFLLAVLFGVTLRLVLAFFPFDVWQQHNFYIFALSSLQAGVVINFGLGWLNLVPIPPLDGSKVVAYFLPGETAWRYLSMERYGFIILLLLLFTGALGYVLGPLVSGSARGLLSLLGLL